MLKNADASTDEPSVNQLSDFGRDKSSEGIDSGVCQKKKGKAASRHFTVAIDADFVGQ